MVGHWASGSPGKIELLSSNQTSLRRLHRLAVSALFPFVDAKAAKAAGFDTTVSYKFEQFSPHIPGPLGEFFSFKGC